MPLATRTNTTASNSEPLQKRAKTEKKLTAKQKKAAAAAAALAEEENLKLETETDENKIIEEDKDISAEDAGDVTTDITINEEKLESDTENNGDKNENETSEAEDTNNISDDTTTKGVKALKITNEKENKDVPKEVNGTGLKENNLSTVSTGSANQTMNTNNNTTAMLESILTETSHIDSSALVVKPKDNIIPPGFALCVGENLSNQLGLGGEIDNRKKPQIIKELPENIVQVSAGGMHSACLTSDGIVYTFGCNDEFALGRGNSADDDISKVDLPEKCIEVTAGDSLTAALSETGVVYAWGTFRVSNKYKIVFCFKKFKT
jgi:hypothetical protein